MPKMTKSMMLGEIMHRLLKKADEAFDPETAEDSDGYDQGVREGFLSSIDVVKEVFNDNA